MTGDGRSGTDDEPRRTDGGQGPEELTDLQGIGAARAERLRDAGFETVADLRDASHADIADVLGPELADSVRSQVGPGDGPDAAAGGSSAPDDSGPSVPPGSGEGGTEPDAPDDSGPSVPPGSGGEKPDTGATGPGDDPDWQPEGSGGQAATDASTGPTTGTTGGSTATAGGGGTAEATVESGPAPAATGAGTTAQEDNEEALLAGLVSFLIPGVGNMITGDTNRGAIILALWIVWLILGWGVVFGGLSIVLTAITLGLGIILVPIIGLVIGVVEFVIHVLAGYDAYRGSKVVDNVTGKVSQVRG